MKTSTDTPPAQIVNAAPSQYGNYRTSRKMPDRALGAVGARLVDTARTLKRKTTPRQSGSGIASQLILALEDVGFFLQGRPTENLLYETGRIIGRRPIPFTLIGVTLGFLLARGTRR